METHVTRQPVLGELRQHVLLPLIGNPLFSEAEQLRANHFVHESEDIARLTRWGANALATRATLRQLNSTNLRGHRARLPQPAPSWVPGACFPDRSDHRAGTLDRQAAVRFQTVAALTFANLLSQQTR